MNSTQNKKIEQVKETTMIVGIDLGSENLATVGLIMLLSRVFDGASDIGHGNHCRKNKFQMGKIKAMDSLDERTVCIIGHSFIYCAAYDGNGLVSLYFCNL